MKQTCRVGSFGPILLKKSALALGNFLRAAGAICAVRQGDNLNRIFSATFFFA
jgi:hypothetical protein